MSIPRNHHHVSQCQIRNFWDKEEECIWVYDKLSNRIFDKKTTKSLFSEKDANSRFKDGKIDHESLELELNKLFESPFTSSYRNLEMALRNKKSEINLDSDLLNLGKYGIAGLIRPPKFKQELDDDVKNVFFNLIQPNADRGVYDEIGRLKSTTFKSKYSNQGLYEDFVNEVLEGMGQVFFEIFYLRTSDYYLLPDFPSFGSRFRINDHFNPDIKEFARVGVPLSSKMFLSMESKKLRNAKSTIHEVLKPETDLVTCINQSSLSNASQFVACESKEYLQEFVEKYS